MKNLDCNILLVLLFFCGLSAAESLVLYSPSNAQVTKGSLDIVEITVDDLTYTSNNDMTCLNSVQRVVVTKSHKGVLKLGQKIKLSRHISKDIPLLKGKNMIYVIAIPTDFFSDCPQSDSEIFKKTYVPIGNVVATFELYQRGEITHFKALNCDKTKKVLYEDRFSVVKKGNCYQVSGMHKELESYILRDLTDLL
ncbi:hypothetical protein [Rheinheimera soli]|uniref:hypothetical protein n=1 Tax=Rheinheimera soli TaxID=443616 RepID=UPI001E4A157C|nr:hypothetical protein [Rheinheimera soli]